MATVTHYLKLRVIQRFLEGWSVTSLASAFGVSTLEVERLIRVRLNRSRR